MPTPGPFNHRRIIIHSTRVSMSRQDACSTITHEVYLGGGRHRRRRDAGERPAAWFVMICGVGILPALQNRSSSEKLSTESGSNEVQSTKLDVCDDLCDVLRVLCVFAVQSCDGAMPGCAMSSNPRGESGRIECGKEPHAGSAKTMLQIGEIRTGVISRSAPNCHQSPKGCASSFGVGMAEVISAK